MAYIQKILQLICWLILTPVFTLESSCKIVTAVRKMNSEEATTAKWENGEKTVVFIDMAHVGKQEFYDDVKNIIEQLKKEGFVVYYERVNRQVPSDSNIARTYQWVKETGNLHYYNDSENKDSVANDIYIKKWRKMMGIITDSAGYAKFLHENNLFKNLISQPQYDQLGIDENDLRVDITLPDIVEEYEKRFDTIRLNNYDFATPIKAGFDYPALFKEPKNNVNTIIIDYRNYYLANYIQTSPDKKIVVVYGLAHREGTFKELSRMDKKWKRKK